MSKSPSNNGIGFVGMLTIVFITLKLCDVIDWSWWWVLSPIWIMVGIFGVIAMGLLLWAMLDEVFERRRNK